MATTDRTPHPARPGRRDLLALLALAASVLFAPAPARAQSGPDSLNLWWTAPGDDWLVGTVAGYDVRWSTQPITPLNFGTANPVPPPPPVRAGQRQRAIARGLTRGITTWFAVLASDESGNRSGLSNVVRYDWPIDEAPPAAPEGVTALVLDDGRRVRLSWQPSSEPDFAGYYVYRSSSRNGPWDRLTRGSVKDSGYLDDTVPEGLDQPWYEVTAVDLLGNESAHSAAISVPRSALIKQGFRWRLDTGYPNPVKVGQVQHIPLTLPAGAHGAVLQIVDAAGQRVRRFDVPADGPGVTEIHWDGLNDAGRVCAPGLYRAWLDAEGTRQVVRLVRVP